MQKVEDVGHEVMQRELCLGWCAETAHPGTLPAQAGSRAYRYPVRPPRRP